MIAVLCAVFGLQAANMAINKQLVTSGTQDYRTIVPWTATGHAAYQTDGAVPESSFSVGMWFKPTGAHSSHKGLVMSHGTNNHCNINGHWLFTIDTSANIAFKVVSGDNYNSLDLGISDVAIGNAAFNEWHYLLLSVDNVNNHINVWLDGEKKLDRDVAGPCYYKWSDGVFHFASHGFGGLLDQAEIYGVALTDEQAAQAKEDASTVEGINALYTFDEIAAATTSQFNNQLKNGNGINATYQRYNGDADWGNGPIHNGSHTEVEQYTALVEGRHIPSYYKLTVVDNGAEIVMLDGDSEEITDLDNIFENTEITMQVIAPEGKVVDTVMLGDTELTADENGIYTFTVAGNATLTINLRDKEAERFTITVAPCENGSVTVTNENGVEITEANPGQEITITASPAKGYDLGTLTVNGNDFTSGTKFTVEANVEIAATFVVHVKENKALSFASRQGYGSADDRLEIPESILTDRTENIGYDELKTSFTYSGWFNIRDWFQGSATVGSGIFMIGQRVHDNNNPSLGLMVLRPADYSNTNKRGNGGILSIVCADTENKCVAGNLTEEGSTLNLDEWVYLTLMYDLDNKAVRVYKDGKKLTERKLNIGLRLLPDYPGIISTGGFALNGNCDELQFWTRALSDSEVLKAYYDATTVPGLDLRYELDEPKFGTIGVFENTGTTDKAPDLEATYYNISRSKTDYSSQYITNLTNFTEKEAAFVEGHPAMELPDCNVTVSSTGNGTVNVTTNGTSLPTGENTVQLGKGITITAVAAENNALVSLKYNGEYIANGSTIDVVSDATIEAVFTDRFGVLTIADTDAEYTLTALTKTEPSLASVPEGTEFSLSVDAVPTGRTIDRITLGETVLEAGENGKYGFTFEGTATLTIATRDLIPYTVTYNKQVKNGFISVTKPDNSVVESGDTVYEAETIIINATSVGAYDLQSLSLNGEYIENGTEHVMDSDVVINATFSEATGFVAGYQQEGSYNYYYSFRSEQKVLGDREAGKCDAPENLGETDHRSRSFTYSAWIKPTAPVKATTRDGRLMGDIQDNYLGSNGAFNIAIVNGKLALRTRVYKSATEMPELAVVNSDVDINLDEWVFLSIVANNEDKTIKVYKNWELAAEASTATDKDGNEAYGIGLLPDYTRFFVFDNGAAGYIEEVQIWNRALTQKEVRRSCRLNTAKALPEGLVALYHPRKGQTEIVNMAVENSDTAYMYYGSLSSNKMSQPKHYTFTYSTGAHIPGTFDVTYQQPTDEIGTFALKGEDDRIIEGKAWMFEPLSLDTSNISGAKVKGVNVSTDGGEAEFYPVDELPFEIEGNVTVSLSYEVERTVLLTYKGEHGTVMGRQGFNEFTLGDTPVEINKNSKLILTFIPDVDYEFVSAKINGEAVTPSRGTLEYQVENRNLNLEVLFAHPVYTITVEGPEENELNVFPTIVDEGYCSIDASNPWVAEVERTTVVKVIIFGVSEDLWEEDGNHNIIHSVTDNGTDVTEQLITASEDDGFTENDMIYELGEVRANHHIVVSQGLKNGIMTIGADNSSITVNGNLIVADGTITVCDMEGRTVARSENELSTESLAKGAYIVSVANGSTLKIIIL